MKNNLLLLVTVLFLTGCCTLLRINCPEDEMCTATDGYKSFASNVQLYDCLYNTTLRREAFSDEKDRNQGINFTRDALALRQEFIDADTDLKLMQALIHMSALREDTHLKIDPLNNLLNGSTSVPIRFLPEFGKNAYTFFVANFDTNLKSNDDRVNYSSLSKGDILIAVNDMPMQEYVKILGNHLGRSTTNNFLWAAAQNLHRKRNRLDPNLYSDDDFVKFTLKKPNGDQYFVKLKYTNSDDNLDLNLGANYTRLGYTRLNLLGITDNFDIYTKPNIILIELKGMSKYDSLENFGGRRKREFFNEQLDSLYNWAEDNDRLSNNIILDATQARGGSGAPLLVKRLAKAPFKTTFGNIRISDEHVRRYVDDRLSNKVFDWYEEAADNSQPYTTNRPFKLRYNEVDDAGIMYPESNFTGPVVALFSSQGGSNLDQLSAMLHDNDLLCHSIGYPTGGYSNTWEFEDTIRDNSGKDYAIYQWTIGHTIRPNGELLEGNPADVMEQIDLTSTNFESYWNNLVRSAESRFPCVDFTDIIVIPETPLDGRILPRDVGCEVIDCCEGCPGWFRDIEMYLQSNFIQSIDLVYLNSKLKKEKLTIQNGKAKKFNISSKKNSILTINYTINKNKLKKIKAHGKEGNGIISYTIFDKNIKKVTIEDRFTLAK